MKHTFSTIFNLVVVLSLAPALWASNSQDSLLAVFNQIQDTSKISIDIQHSNLDLFKSLHHNTKTIYFLVSLKLYSHSIRDMFLQLNQLHGNHYSEENKKNHPH